MHERETTTAKTHDAGTLPRSRTFVVLLLALSVALVGLGCSRTDQPAQVRSLRCGYGTLWDFRTGECVAAPEDKEQHALLFGSNEYGNLVQEVPDVSILNQVMFSKWLTRSEFESIVDDPGIERVEMIWYRFPNVRAGWTSSEVVPTATRSENAIDVSIERMLADRRSVSSTSLLAEELTVAFQENDFRIGITRLRATPRAFVAWWGRHADFVRITQPMITDDDVGHQVWEPDEPVE